MEASQCKNEVSKLTVQFQRECQFLILKAKHCICIFLLNVQKQFRLKGRECVCVCVLVTQSLLATSWIVACQAPLSMEFSRQEYWMGSHSLLQGIFLTQRLNVGLLHCRQILSSLFEPSKKPKGRIYNSKVLHDLKAYF